MRKSLPKTPHSGLSSRAAPAPLALLAVAAAGRGHAFRSNASSEPSDEPPRLERLSARLRLLDGFLGRTEIIDCAQLAVEWMADSLGIRQSLCLVRPVEDNRLVTVASHG